MCCIPGQDPRNVYKKECQDNCFSIECTGVFLFGIFDGHGRNGKAVSLYCGDVIQDEFIERAERFKRDPQTALRELLLDVNDALVRNELIDTSMSGTTACVAYFDFKNIYVANVGDSRGMLATTCKPDTLTKSQLMKLMQRGPKILDSV
jgi:serine/threonine protein phosphatase PrpC